MDFEASAWDCDGGDSEAVRGLHFGNHVEMGLGISVLTRLLFLGNLPFWQGRQEFTSRGTLSYNWLEKNLVGGRKSKTEK